MNCPVCDKNMIEQDFGGVKPDVCKNGCKSIWFDWFELAKLDEKNEGYGEALKEAAAYPRANDANRPPLNCPKCGVRMHSHKYQHAREVNVDECYNCGGFFLDSGELGAVRETHMTEQEEQAYCDKLVADMPAYQEGKKNLEMEKVRAKALRQHSRFLRLSYYVTGK